MIKISKNWLHQSPCYFSSLPWQRTLHRHLVVITETDRQTRYLFFSETASDDNEDSARGREVVGSTEELKNCWETKAAGR